MIRDKRMLGYAYALTFKSEHKIPVAAILSRGNSIIGQSTNVIKTHPLQKNQYMREDYSKSHALSTHAEVMLLGNLKYSKKHTLYICRRRKDGFLGMAKPCPVCMDVVEKSGVGKVVYSISGNIKNPHCGVMYI
jgi:tRNA(Arg) A34 adenosine deaminase TadA